MDALLSSASPYESWYKFFHGKLFYGGGFSLPMVGAIKCREHHDESRFVCCFFALAFGVSSLPILAAWRRSRSVVSVGICAAPLCELLRFTAKWGYAAFGIGLVPRSVKRLAAAVQKPGAVRFVVVSDTHNEHSKLTLPDGDVLIHCGDFSEHGTEAEIVEFNEWLGTAAGKFKRRIVVAGNHDLGLDPDLDDRPWRELVLSGKQVRNGDRQASAASLKALLTNCEYLEGEEAPPEQGIRIYGAPWTPAIAVSGVFQVPGAFNRNPANMKQNFKPTKATWLRDHEPYVPTSMTSLVPSLEECWARVPVGIDVLVTHGPPKGIGDEDMGFHYGDPLLNGVVQRVRPQFHVFGHIHPAYGVTTKDNVTYVSAASVTLLHDAKHAPIVFDIPVKC